MEKDEFSISLFSNYPNNHVDFNLSELQALVRVVTLICKDQYENTIIEGLKCLRVTFHIKCER